MMSPPMLRTQGSGYGEADACSVVILVKLHELVEERTSRIAAEIEEFINTESAYLDPHLKLEQVVERCSFSRKYVSQVLSERFGGFSGYVNGLRIAYYDHYRSQHPHSTEDAAAEASGFTSYNAYVKAKERLQK